jgi:predicted 3-demethylubiquinone-9 3-methyltransferase (glyoxalase superfamily)
MKIPFEIIPYINYMDEKTFNNTFEKLSNNGIILMGPEAFSTYRKAAWVTDKYGVTWQVILEQKI